MTHYESEANDFDMLTVEALVIWHVVVGGQHFHQALNLFVSSGAVHASVLRGFTDLDL